MIIAGTGHRPQHLPCGFNENHIACLKYKEKIKNFLLENKKEIKYVISGVAIGLDFWLAEIAIELGIKVHAYIPFKGQENKWPEKTKTRYKNILRKCDNVVLVSEGGYDVKKLFKRNESMVDSCDLVLALWNPEKQSGGTFSTIEYARKIGKPISNLWLNEKEEIPF